MSSTISMVRGCSWSGLAYSIGVASTLALAGCGSSPEDKLYEAFKCSKAATLLEQESDGDTAMESAAPYLQQMAAAGGSPARLAMEMNQRFQDDVPLYRLTVGSQMALLSDIYQSDECQALYTPTSGSADSGTHSASVTPTSAINLAGCPVPPGIPWEEAERITCGPAADTQPQAQVQAPYGRDAVQEAPAPDNEVVENAIANTANSEEGDEYKGARKVVVGDLNGDGASDAAALFTIEVASRNSYTQYLSAFLRQGDGSLKLADTTPVGGAGNAIIEVAVEEGAVRLKTLTLGPDDANCCPSEEGTDQFLVHNGKLKRVI